MAVRSSPVSFSAIAKGMLLRRLFCSSTTIAATLPSFLSQATDDEAAQAPGRVQYDPNPNLFVSGLCKRTTSERLREAFSEFGEVVSARVVADKRTHYSKGYGFVRYASTEEAQKGLEGMDGKFLDEWVISVEYASPRPTDAAPQNHRGPGYRSSTYPSRDRW